MFPAIFAVLLLGHFTAANIYVGQNPQNVNAVIKDANGNLVPVTGVADEIVVVDLNYGGEGNSSGMSVEVSVSPVNGSSNISSTPSSLGSPSGPGQIFNPPQTGAGQISNPPLSAAPGSFPSGPASSITWPSTLPPGVPSTPSIWNPFSNNTSNSGSSGFGSTWSGFPTPAMFPPKDTGFNSATPSPSNSLPELPSKSPVSEYDNLVSDLSGPSSTTKNGASSSVSNLNTYYYPQSSFPHVRNVRSAQYDEYLENRTPTTSFASQNYFNVYPSAFPPTSYSSPNQFSQGYPFNYEQTSFAHPPNTWASGYPTNPSVSGWPVPGSNIGTSPALNFDFPTPASAPWPSALSDYNSSPGGYPETYVPPPPPPPPPPPVIEPPVIEPPILPNEAESIVNSILPNSVIIPVFPQSGEETYNYTIAGNGAIINTVTPPMNTIYTSSYPPTFFTPIPTSGSSGSSPSNPPTGVPPSIGSPFTVFNPFTTPKPPNPFTLPYTRSTPQPISSSPPVTQWTSSGYYTTGTVEPTTSGYPTGFSGTTNLGNANSGSGSGGGQSGSGYTTGPYNPFTTPNVIITSMQTNSHKTKSTTKETTKPFTLFNPFTFSTTEKHHTKETKNPFSFFNNPFTLFPTPKPKTTTSGPSTGTGSGFSSSSGTGTGTSSFNPFTSTTHKITTKKTHHGFGFGSNPGSSGSGTGTTSGFGGSGTGTTSGFGGSGTGTGTTSGFGGSGTGTGTTSSFGGSGTGITSSGSGSGTGTSVFNPFTPNTHKTTTENPHHGFGFGSSTSSSGGSGTGTTSGSSSGTGTSVYNPFTPTKHKTTTKKPHHGFSFGSSTSSSGSGTGTTSAFGGSGTSTASSGSGSGTGTSGFNPFTPTTHKTTTKKPHHGFDFGSSTSSSGSGTGTGSGTGSSSSSTGTSVFNPFTPTTHKTTTKKTHHNFGFGSSTSSSGSGTGTTSGFGSTSTGTGSSGTGTGTSTGTSVFNPFTPTKHKTTTEKPHHGFGFGSGSGSGTSTSSSGSGSGSSTRNPFSIFNPFKTTTKSSNNPFNIFNPFATTTKPTTSKKHHKKGSSFTNTGSASGTGSGFGSALGTGAGFSSSGASNGLDINHLKSTTKTPFSFFTQSTTPKPVTTAFGGTATGLESGSGTESSTKKPKSNGFNPFNFFTTPKSESTSKKNENGKEKPGGIFDLFPSSTTPKSVTTAFGGSKSSKGSKSEGSPFDLFKFPTTPKSESSSNKKHSGKNSGSSSTGSSGSGLGTGSGFDLGTGSGFQSGFGTATGSGSGTGTSKKSKKKSGLFAKSDTATAGSSKSKDKNSKNPFNFFKALSGTDSKSNSKSVLNPFSQSTGKKGGKKSFFNFPKKSPSLFIELGGGLGPVENLSNSVDVGAQNNTPSITSVPLFSSLTPSTIPLNLASLTSGGSSSSIVNATIPGQHQNKKWNKKNSLPNFSNVLMNFSSPFAFPSNSNATPLNGFLNSLFNTSVMNLQQINNTSPFTGLINSFMNGAQQPMLNQGSSSWMNSFLDPSAFLPPMNGSSSSPITDMLNSFMNGSSLFNSSSADSASFDDMMDSLFQSIPSMFGQNDGNSSSLTNMMNSILNSTSSMFNLANSTTNSFADMMNSVFNSSSSLFSPSAISGSPFSGLFQPSSSASPFSHLLTLPSGKSSPLKGILGDTSGDEGYISDYPEDDIYQDSDDDEDYFNPLPSLLPPKKSSSSASSVPSSAFNPLQSLLPPKKSPSVLSGADPTSSEVESLMNGISNMENNLLDQSTNGTTLFTKLVNSVFGGNGSIPSTANLFSMGGLLNPMSFINGTPFSLNSTSSNFAPMSNWLRIISSLNNTGLFGDLSGVYNLTQDLSSLVSQDMNNKTANPTNLNQIINDLVSMGKSISPILQTFMNNTASKLPSMNTASQPAFPSKSLPLGFGSSFLVLPPPSAPIPAVPEGGTQIAEPAYAAPEAGGQIEPISDVEKMVVNLITPYQNGTSPLSSLLDGLLGINGSTLPPNLFSMGGPMDPFTYSNYPSVNLSSFFANFTPFSLGFDLISALNGTGLFGNLTDLSNSVKAMSSDVPQGGKNPANVAKISKDFLSLWKSMMPVIQKFMSYVASKSFNVTSTGFLSGLSDLSGVTSDVSSVVSQLPNNTQIPADLDEITGGLPSTWKSMMPLVQSLLGNATSEQANASVPQPRLSKPFLPLMGSSFLALPTLPAAAAMPQSMPQSDIFPSELMQGSAPASDVVPPPTETTTPAPTTPETTPQPATPPPATNPSSSTNSGAPASSTPTPSNTNGTKTPPNAGGINLSSAWITLVGCLFVAFSQKNFLGLI